MSTNSIYFPSTKPTPSLFVAAATAAAATTTTTIATVNAATSTTPFRPDESSPSQPNS